MAAAIAGSGSAEEVLKRAAAPPLARFGKRVAALVAEELHPLLNSHPLHSALEALSTELRAAWLADVCNEAYSALRLALIEATTKNVDLCRVVGGEEAMGELKLASRIASASHAKVECGVDWTAPASMAEMKEVAKAMSSAQAAAVQLLRDKQQADAALDALDALVRDKQMPLYKRRVEALDGEGGQEELHVKLPSVVADLLPKFEKIYRATGDGLVRNEAGYRYGRAHGAARCGSVAGEGARGRCARGGAGGGGRGSWGS